MPPPKARGNDGHNREYSRSDNRMEVCRKAYHTAFHTFPYDRSSRYKVRHRERKIRRIFRDKLNDCSGVDTRQYSDHSRQMRDRCVDIDGSRK